MVAIDQFCWYLDILSYLVRGKHLVGVVDYLFYPENRTWVRWATSAHHVWFMPLVLMVRALLRVHCCASNVLHEARAPDPPRVPCAYQRTGRSGRFMSQMLRC